MPEPAETKPAAEQRLERSYQVRQVTHFQTSWQGGESGQKGRFTIQLILDHGVEVYILQPEAEDANVLVKLLAEGGYIGFDIARRVLMFPNHSAK